MQKGSSTGWMSCLKHPVGVLRIRNQVIVPFDLKVAGDTLKSRRPRERMDIELGFGRHISRNFCCHHGPVGDNLS